MATPTTDLHAAAAPGLTVVSAPAEAVVDKTPAVPARQLPAWIHSKAAMARRTAHAIGHHPSVIWIGWSARGWWHIARVERDKLRGDYPQMIRTARHHLAAVRGDMTKEAQAHSVATRREEQYKNHKRKYWIKKSALVAPVAGAGIYGVAECGTWIALLYAVAAVTAGAWRGRPRGIDPGKVEILAEDGDPFPIADARNRTEAAECVRRALASEGIQVKEVEANRRHDWGWEVTVRLAKGKPADIVTKAPDLETPLDLPENGLHCQPVRASRGQVVLRLVQSDPFDKMPAAPERKPNSFRMRDRQVIAYRMDGQKFDPSLLGVHVIVVAGSGGGKSVILRALADTLTACSDVLVGDLDPGGNGLAPLAEAVGVRAIGDDNMGQIEKILEQALKIAKARPSLFAKLGMKENWEPSPERPAIVLFIDEYPQLSDRAKELAVKILQTGRKSRVQLVLATQEVNKDTIGSAIADTIALKIVGPCRRQDVVQVFGGGAGDEGWRPDRLDPAEGNAQGDDLRDASQAYIRGGGSREPLKHKFLFLEGKEGRRRARERAAAGRPTVDAESLRAAGLDRFGATEADRLRSDLPKIVMMARGAFAAADDPAFLPTVEIVDYLGTHDPDVWALERLGEDEQRGRLAGAKRLAAELKRAIDALDIDVDVSTVQITGGARGYRLETIKQITGESAAEAA
ncbi:type IV secretory system conjugative DNA transfer family protein [Streptomyces griseorubiginosus]|uniref:type IV secretory system conjugative DNA transfer family protein n=1 Tax=Streptomyces griseorubiginosus TaxID=67304 RepID=UPI003333AD36